MRVPSKASFLIPFPSHHSALKSPAWFIHLLAVVPSSAMKRGGFRISQNKVNKSPWGKFFLDLASSHVKASLEDGSSHCSLIHSFIPLSFYWTPAMDQELLVRMLHDAFSYHHHDYLELLPFIFHVIEEKARVQEEWGDLTEANQFFSGWIEIEIPICSGSGAHETSFL